ncbi:MAG TPA: hypothetical protein VF594_11900 [Rubricoccaceae bacterium]|jgi:pimeloyl-ACP methyl ester carboxylesterase
MSDPVLLFHGLGRRAASMQPMARALAAAGYSPTAVAYPSTGYGVADLVAGHVAPAVDRLLDGGATRVHFVTHSLGGVLVRAFAAERSDAGRPLPAGSRAVFLAPPHGGSEVADALHAVRPAQAALGPVLAELTTGAATGGPIRGIEAGIVAGTRRLVPFGSAFAAENDGLVSVQSAFAAGGEADTAVVARTHALIMRAPDVIALTLRFLETGRFTA